MSSNSFPFRRVMQSSQLGRMAQHSVYGTAWDFCILYWSTWMDLSLHFPIQFFANAAVDDISCAWAGISHFREPHGVLVPGFSLAQHWLWQSFGERISFYFCLPLFTSFCLSINKALKIRYHFFKYSRTMPIVSLYVVVQLLCTKVNAFHNSIFCKLFEFHHISQNSQKEKLWNQTVWIKILIQMHMVLRLEVNCFTFFEPQIFSHLMELLTLPSIGGIARFNW